MPSNTSKRWLVLSVMMLLGCVASFAQIISVSFAPPALPVYEQPLLPSEGYIWTPGYWAYDYNFGDYYWVPGTWVLAPEPGLLWTPPYWAWSNNAYLFHEGYWAPQVGFYGGIPYGYGYFGHGYEGGRWEHGQFYYNRAVNNINATNIHNVYVSNVQETNVRRISYNGGDGGINARPTAEEETAARERHFAPVAAQMQHRQSASANTELRASANHGKPPVAATERPTAFSGAGVVPAKEAGAPYHPPANRPKTEANAKATAPASVNESAPQRAASVHARDLPPSQRPAPPNTGNSQADKKYQQQQDKLYQQQAKDRQKLEQGQERDHQKLAQQNANAQRNQQMEQMHQQQTQQMVEKHAQQQQQMAQRHAQQQPQSHPPQSAHNAPPPEKH